jgi:hypothetical protein
VRTHWRLLVLVRGNPHRVRSGMAKECAGTGFGRIGSSDKLLSQAVQTNLWASVDISSKIFTRAPERV